MALGPWSRLRWALSTEHTSGHSGAAAPDQAHGEKETPVFSLQRFSLGFLKLHVCSFPVAAVMRQRQQRLHQGRPSSLRA